MAAAWIRCRRACELKCGETRLQGNESVRERRHRLMPSAEIGICFVEFESTGVTFEHKDTHDACELSDKEHDASASGRTAKADIVRFWMGSWSDWLQVDDGAAEIRAAEREVCRRKLDEATLAVLSRMWFGRLGRRIAFRSVDNEFWLISSISFRSHMLLRRCSRIGVARLFRDIQLFWSMDVCRKSIFLFWILSTYGNKRKMDLQGIPLSRNEERRHFKGVMMMMNLRVWLRFFDTTDTNMKHNWPWNQKATWNTFGGWSKNGYCDLNDKNLFRCGFDNGYFHVWLIKANHFDALIK